MVCACRASTHVQAHACACPMCKAVCKRMCACVHVACACRQESVQRPGVGAEWGGEGREAGVLVRGAAYRARASPTAAAASTAPTPQRTTPTPRRGCAARRPAAPSADAPPGTCAPPRRACGAPARRAPRRPSASATRPRGGSACSCALAGGHYGCCGGCAACSRSTRYDPNGRPHLPSPQPIPTPPPAPDQGCTVRGMALTAAAMVALRDGSHGVALPADKDQRSAGLPGGDGVRVVIGWCGGGGVRMEGILGLFFGALAWARGEG